MFLSWLKKRRRRRLLATPIPPDWPGILERIAHFRILNPTEQARLVEITRILIAEKEFEGCQGLDITDEIRVTIAALAGILIIGLRDFYFDNVLTILVYPEAYVAPKQQVIGGVVLEDQSNNLGEAHYRGPLILSWEDVDRDARRTGTGSNLVFHEFAHQLDMLNGAADGVPVLLRPLRKSWQTIMAREYQRLCRTVNHGRQTLIDPYGTTNPAEFFAVVTECFFDDPAPMKKEHPELYDLFRKYYQQDPAERGNAAYDQ
jgi:Mlc titration factor MtfA (ptsG expression regulator)